MNPGDFQAFGDPMQRAGRRTLSSLQSAASSVCETIFASLRIAREPRAVLGRAGPAGLVLLMTAAALCGACAGSRNPAPREGAVDLMDRFAPVEPLQPGEIRKGFFVARQGERRESLVLVAPAAVRAPLEGASGDLIMEALAAPVFNLGDGIRMDLFLVHDGKKELLASRYFDAGRRAEDRRWIRMESLFRAGAGDSLEIRVSGGPQGDLVADWLALSSLRVMPVKSPP